MTYFKQQREEIKKGCGLKESVGSPICEKDNLCDECETKLQQLNKDEDAVRKAIEKRLHNLHTNGGNNESNIWNKAYKELISLREELGLNSKEEKA